MKFLAAKVWLTIGVLMIIASLSFAFYEINQAFIASNNVEGNDNSLVIKHIDLAINSSVFIGIGSVFIGIGLIKYLNDKKKSQIV